MERNAGRGLGRAVDDVLFGCANQAGEDNRNVARMASLLAGLPESVPGVTVNRLCGSGMEAIGSAARAIKAGEGALAIAGGVESMTRAPFVMAKAETAFSRQAHGPRHHARLALRQQADEGRAWHRFHARDRRERGRGVPGRARATRTPTPSAASAAPRKRSRRAGSRARSPRSRCRSARPTRSPSREDEHPRPQTTLEGAGEAADPLPRGGHRDRRQRVGRQRRRLRPAGGLGGGRPAPRAGRRAPASSPWRAPASRPASWASGPAPASRKVLAKRRALDLDRMDVIELNEAFAAQVLAVTRELGLPDDAEPREPQRRRHRLRPSPRHERRAAGAHRRARAGTSRAAATRSAPCASASARASP